MLRSTTQRQHWTNRTARSASRSLSLAICLCGSAALAQPERPLDPIAKALQPDRLVVYKSVASHALKVHVFEPTDSAHAPGRSAFVIFHGGGWVGANLYRTYPFADYFRRRGMVAVCPEYRLLRRDEETTVFDCVRDARSAIRYLRLHAEEFGIDPQKIVVAGCSAGGHLAAGTALFDGIDEQTDDRSVSAAANALVLYYPVIDTSIEGYGQQKIGDRWEEISPRHQVRAGMPPTLLVHGEADTVTPFAGAREFHKAMQGAGNTCELVSHEGGGHGHIIFDRKLFDAAMIRTHQFLQTHSLVPQEGQH